MTSDEFFTLANEAVASLRAGDFTPALVICDALEEYDDPRAERLRTTLLALQGEVIHPSAEIREALRAEFAAGRDIANLSPEVDALITPLALARHKTHLEATRILTLWLVTPPHLPEPVTDSKNRNLIPPTSL